MLRIVVVPATIPFSKMQPFVDIDITPKMFIRLYPSEFKELATDGITWANSGIVTGTLNWAVTKRN